MWGTIAYSKMFDHSCSKYTIPHTKNISIKEIHCIQFYTNVCPVHARTFIKLILYKYILLIYINNANIRLNSSITVLHLGLLASLFDKNFVELTPFLYKHHLISLSPRQYVHSDGEVGDAYPGLHRDVVHPS